MMWVIEMNRKFRVRTNHSLSVKKQNRKNLFLIACIVLTLCGAMGYQRVKLEAKQKKVQAEYKSLQQKQEKLKEEKEEMKDQEVYMNTKKYVEEQARDKLGLVYPDEIIFTPEEK